jgi:predicted nucleic-acid-binding protein
LVGLGVIMVRRQSAANSAPHLFAKTKARFYDLFQLFNLLIQACCHTLSFL